MNRRDPLNRLAANPRKRMDQNKLRRNKNIFKQRQALQKIGRPSLGMLEGKTLLPPGSRRGFLPSELEAVGDNYGRMNGGGPDQEQWGGETQPGGYYDPNEQTGWEGPDACDCSCYGAGATPQGGGCWSQGQPVGPCC